ncbi:MAG: hypothetical protein KBF21_17065 [Thermoanaerobaculia bacterium]|nr:hypothetical protein [Thermoanaerobaculia bacterium]
MSLTETSTVGLNLGGNWAEKAREDYEAAVKLTAGLDELAQASAKVKAPAVWTTGDNIKWMEASAKAAAESAQEAARAHERAAAEAEAAWAKTMRAMRAASAAAGGMGDGVDEESIRRANRIPTELQSSPEAVDMAAALERESRKAGSAIKAAANGALEEAAAIAKSVEQAKKLSSVYDLVAKRAKESAKAESAAEQEAFNRANKLPQVLQQAPPVFSKFQSLVGGIEKVFGPGAAASFVKGASGLAEISDKYSGAIRIAGGAIKVGGAAVAAGAVLLAAAAAALGVAAIKLGSAVVEMGIEQTSLRERAQAAIGTGGYDVSIKLAAKYGLSSEEAIQQVKGLLNAKFSETEIPALVRIAVGIGELKGAEKAKGFLEKLEVQKAKGGKATEETVKGFAEVGLNADSVYAKLAETLGVTVAQAQAKVKAGMLDTKTVLDAVTKAAESQFGGAADKLADSVPVLVARLKLGFGQLFSEMDLGPLKEVLKNLLGVLEGGEGANIKGALKELFDAISHAFLDPFRGEDGKARLEAMVKGAAAVIRDLSDIVRTVAPLIEWAADSLVGWSQAADQAGGAATTLKAVILTMLGPFGWLLSAAFDAGAAIAEWGTSAGDTAYSGGASVGTNFVAGVTDGLLGSIGGAFAAADSLAGGLLGRVRSVLDINSPSGEAEALMGYFGAGMVKGAANDTGASQAGSMVAAQVMGSTEAGLAGGAGGGAGAGGGGAVTIIVQVTPAPGASPAEIGDAVGEAAYAAWQRHARRAGRERAA